MQLLQDGIIAALAAIGLMTLLWLPVSALARPRCRADALVVLPCRAGTDAAELEQAVRALERERRECGSFCRIVLLDRGMNEDARRTAALLCREGRGVSLCTGDWTEELA